MFLRSRSAILRRGFPFLLLLSLGAVLAGAAAYAGRFLVVQDPLQKVDAIFVLSGSRADRWLEAADLYRAGYAPLIVLSSGPTDGAEIFLRERGIELPMEGEEIRDILVRLGIPAAAVLPLDDRNDNTGEEASNIRELARRRNWRALIVVTSKYHTRRARLAMRRGFSGLPTTIVMRASRYDLYNAGRWWQRRADLRNTLFELAKLTAYATGLG